jgi:2-succinyl-6-hydroxy-2,4-cyclohexadiene-1-carboxylate synthase
MFLPYIEKGAGARVALLHGFTQTKSAWDPVIALLGNDFHTISFDAPGHGDAAMLPFNCSEAAEAVNNIAGDATYVGYSLGGRIMLHAALLFPEEVERLVLISASPGIQDPTEREARIAADSTLAERIGSLGVEAFVDDWMSMPMFAGLDSSNNQRAARLTNTADGLIRSLKLCGTGAQESFWSRLGELKMPVLLIVGESDQKFVDLNQEMKNAIGSNAQLEIVPGVGHSVPLEDPECVARLIAEFVA